MAGLQCVSAGVDAREWARRLAMITMHLRYMGYSCRVMRLADRVPVLLLLRILREVLDNTHRRVGVVGGRRGQRPDGVHHVGRKWQCFIRCNNITSRQWCDDDR